MIQPQNPDQDTDRSKRVLLFVATRFLFPLDSGGKIRTTQVLRGLKGSRFRVVLATPATAELVAQHRDSIDQVCDEFHWWPEPVRGSLFQYTRLRHLMSRVPVPVRVDRHRAGVAMVADLLADAPSVAVFDFVHASILAPESFDCPSLMFTHNVEAEIFRRHLDVSSNPLSRMIWKNQYCKMQAFEEHRLQRFDVVVAVADRDADQFVKDYAIPEPHVIPTGVDLDFFEYGVPTRNRDVVFCGSMDWMANQEGIRFFMDEIWARVSQAVPDAKMTVVGRAPPAGLIEAARRNGFDWTFTGFVDDVRPFVRGAAVSVIPLRVGGGTRLKAYESMALGTPIVSTGIGMEGLPVAPEMHYLKADEPGAFAEAITALLNDDTRRNEISRRARAFVEQNFSYTVAARSFEEACETAVMRFEQRRG